MALYTLRLLEATGELRHAVHQESSSDEEVVGEAEEHDHPHGIEVWLGCRLVARVPAKGAWGLRLPSQ